MKQQSLTIKQLDKKLEQWQGAKDWFRPKNGWIRTIRKALGMTTSQLAERIGLSRSRVIRIEADEIKDVLTLQTMINIADALNCELVYALIPRISLQEMLEQQALKVAIEQIERISHNMLLENQSLPPEQIKEQIENLKTELLSKSPKNLWNKK